MAGNSKGAKAGWAARRATFEKRSAAAKAGWATRRARQRESFEWFEAPVFGEGDIFEVDY